MKARVNQIKSECVLSVGMIVKNEEKYLERCLTALKPLLDAVSSELVIVDTGSTDRTVEIAEKFTDKVHYFEWINDFSAARNFGLEKCVGEWFMFVDADEIFDDLSEMIEFFNSGTKTKQYHSACYIKQEYLDINDDSIYEKIQVVRIAKRNPGLCFKGEIHENLKGLFKPTYYFETFVHHYGYLYENKEQKEAKVKRNLALLLKKLENNPHDIKALCEIADCLYPSVEAEEYLLKAVELSKNSDMSFPYVRPYRNIIRHYLKNEPIKVFKYVDEYVEIADDDEPHLVEAYASKVIALYNLQRYNEVQAATDKYTEYYDKYKKGTLNKEPLYLCTIIYTDEKFYNEIKNIRDISILLSNKFFNTDLISKMTFEKMMESVNILAKLSKDFIKISIETCKLENLSGNVKELLWGLSILEIAVILAANIDLPHNEKSILYTNISQFSSIYVLNIYNPNVLNDSDIGVLPPLYRFGYYMAVAQQSFEDGNLKEYIHALKQALANYPAMKDVVNFFLNKISENIEEKGIN